jgi:hypothetical protein
MAAQRSTLFVFVHFGAHRDLATAAALATDLSTFVPRRHPAFDGPGNTL